MRDTTLTLFTGRMAVHNKVYPVLQVYIAGGEQSYQSLGSAPVLAPLLRPSTGGRS